LGCTGGGVGPVGVGLGVKVGVAVGVLVLGAAALLALTVPQLLVLKISPRISTIMKIEQVIFCVRI
jgi:hypothetical protein